MSDLTTLARGVNLVWILVASFLVFFMKAGFAMLEAGQVRAKNVANQLTQTLITLVVGLGTFFLVGATVAAVVASATSGGPLDPVTAAAHVFEPSNVDSWTTWLFGAMFAIAAANVVSGAVAGRCRPRMYVVYTAVVAGVVYPVASGLVWNGGFLATLGFHDFAGGAVIHALGGLSGVTAAWLVGPRADRYTDEGSVNVIPGHSVTLAVLGTLILCFGWYGFNVGTAVTVFAVQDGHLSLAAFDTVGRFALNTTLGMVAGGAGAGLVAWKRTGKLDTLYLANGLLAGLVGVTAAADVLTWPGAVVLGTLAGAQLPVVFEFVEERLQIDDVCAVFPVHGSAGLLGALAYPVFSTAGFSLAQVGVQVLGVAVVAAWAVGATYLLFRVGRAVGWARVDPDDERDGLDIAAHGLETYPEFGDAEPLSNRGVVTDGGTYPATDGGERDIELVLAYIRPDRLSEVKRSLAEAGAPSITVSNVSGRGSQPAKTGQWRGEEYTVDLHQKVKVECVVADIEGRDVANAIRDGAKTGNKGDGKVFVLPVEQALQIRTGKRGPEAV